MAVLDGHDIVVVAHALPHYPMELAPGTGLRLPAFCTAAGRAILGTLDDDALDAWLAKLKPKPLTEFTPTRLPEIRKAIALARVQGYGATNQEVRLGDLALAVPLKRYDGKTIGAQCDEPGRRLANRPASCLSARRLGGLAATTLLIRKPQPLRRLRYRIRINMLWWLPEGNAFNKRKIFSRATSRASRRARGRAPVLSRTGWTMDRAGYRIIAYLATIVNAIIASHRVPRRPARVPKERIVEAATAIGPAG